MSALPKSKIPRQLARLNVISSGPGAVRVPADVKSVNLSFKFQNSHGHMGPRKFWQANLPQIQFHNPTLPISVNRTYANSLEEHASIPAVLSIKFENGSEKSVNVKNKFSLDILEDFIRLSGATKVPLEEQPVLKKNKDLY